MFARASGKSYVCLRCQHRLALKETSTLSRNNIQHSVRRRWQSASAVARQEKEDDNQPTIHYVDDHLSDERPRTRYRRWQPPPTAKLGFDALGKPAEVLVLPPRERKVRQRREHDRQATQDDGQEEARVMPTPQKNLQLSISEALAEERKSASPTEATENIEQLRNEIEESEQPFDTDVQLKFQKALTMGFSKPQLERYITVKGLQSEKSMIQKSWSKKTIARLIMDRIWKLAQDPVTADPEKPTRAFMHMTAEKFDLIHMTGKDAVYLSNYPGIEMTYDPPKAQLRIIGKPLDVQKFRNMLGRQTVVQSSTRPGISMPHSARLQEMMRRHGVLLKSKPGSETGTYRMWSFERVDMQRFEQELICMQVPKAAAVPEVPPLSLEPLDHAATMPVYLGESTQYHRYLLPISPKTTQAQLIAGNSGNDRFSEVLRNLQEGLQAESITHLNYDFLKSQSKRFSPIFNVELGQAIFQQSERNGTLLDTSAERQSSQSGFLSRIPFLPQFLAQQRLSSLTGSSTQSQTTTISGIGPSHLRITLQPVDLSVHPLIEIHAMSKPSSSLSLQIQEVTLVFTQISRNLPIPSSAIDLRISRKDEFSLVRSELPVEQQHAALLAQIARHLVAHPDGEHVDGTNIEQIFSPTLDLDLTCLKSQNKEATPQMGSQGKGVDSDKLSTTSQAKRKNRGLTDSKCNVRYALGNVEAVDVALYHVPLTSTTTGEMPRGDPSSEPTASTSLLEHLICTPLGSNHEHKRTQIVRVVERPMLHDHGSELSASIGHDEERFKNFIRSSYDVAMALDSFVQKRSEVMVQAHQKSDMES